MTNNTYNGWTNYATWRINLEMFDGMDASFFEADQSIGSIANVLQSMAEETICEQSSGLAQDYAMAFLSEVNWYEIASHFAEDTEAA